MYCQMSFLIGRVFAEVKILKNLKHKTIAKELYHIVIIMMLRRTRWNISLTFNMDC